MSHDRLVNAFERAAVERVADFACLPVTSSATLWGGWQVVLALPLVACDDSNSGALHI